MFLRSQRRRRRRRSPAVDSYLTDGQKLFRVSSLLDDGRSVLAWIEDCLTLEMSAVTADELELTGWRSVRPACVDELRLESCAETQDRQPALLH